MESTTAPGALDLVEGILAATTEVQRRGALEAGEWTWSERARLLWDAVLHGRLASRSMPERWDADVMLLADERLRTSTGGFTHEHALHGLRTVDIEAHRVLGEVLVDMIGTLPADPLDEVLAPFMSAGYLEQFARLRLLDGGLPETLFDRPLFPRPGLQKACRRQVLEGEYTRFQSIEELFPPGDAALASAVVRYGGPGLLREPLTLLRRRGQTSEALAAALAVLQDPETEGIDGLRGGACVLATVLSAELGQGLPEPVLRALAAIRVPRIRCAFDREAFSTTLASLPAEPREALAILVAPEPRPTPAEPSQ